MKTKQITRFGLICATLVLWLAGAWLAWPRSVAGRAVQPVALRGAAAVERLKQDGQYESLQAALNFTLEQKLTVADGAADDHFGNAVALDGDTLAVGVIHDDVGSNYNQGSVYVFTRSGSAWTLQQKIASSDGETKDIFGGAVALEGDTLVVTASGDDVGANTRQGSVYVFRRNGAAWTQQQKLTASDGAAGDRFGSAVSLSGDHLVVGAAGADIGANAEQGAAYVFRRTGAGWMERQKLTANDGAADDYFGYAAALDGDMVVVGAYGDDVGANMDQGSAYVFRRGGSMWTQQQKLTAFDGAAHDYFGIAVAISGDTVAVGASEDDHNENEDDGDIPNRGSVYVFTRSGMAWPLQQKLTGSDSAAYDYFGSAVALDGDTLAVGVQHDDWWWEDRGSVYVFERSGVAWTESQKLMAGDGAAYDYFGGAVALSGGSLAVGASGDDIGSTLSQGSAYVFAIPSCPAFTFEPASLPNGLKWVSYQQWITAGGGEWPYQFALISGALPPGLTLSPDGLLSGTPTAVGVYQFTIRASDSSASGPCFGSHTYYLTIDPNCSTFTIDPPTLPEGAVGELYNETLTVTGGVEPYTFSKSGTLPPGLSLSADGVLSGTPIMRIGRFSFTVTVTDAEGCVGARKYILTINPPLPKIGAAARPKR